MSYLRFTTSEYRALRCLWDSLRLSQEPQHIVRRLLTQGLAAMRPALAIRVRAFRTREMRILCNHLRAGESRAKGHDLSARELRLVREMAGGLLAQERFVQPMRRLLVEHFRDQHPVLAGKLDRMSLHQFAGLYRADG